MPTAPVLAANATATLITAVVASAGLTVPFAPTTTFAATDRRRGSGTAPRAEEHGRAANVTAAAARSLTWLGAVDRSLNNPRRLSSPNLPMYRPLPWLIADVNQEQFFVMTVFLALLAGLGQAASP
jgi:hypothetical protein